MSVSDSTYTATFGDGASVLERVLLAIINAHTTDEAEGCQAERLQAAMTALIGSAMSDRHDMDKALLFIMRQRQKDICDFEMRTLRSCSGASVNAVRSVPELAKLAAREVLGCTTATEVKANASVLGEMFRKRGTVYGLEPDHMRQALEAEAVRKILGELAEWDVPSTCQN